MAARAYWIQGPWKGRLAIVPRPQGGEWLKDIISDWRDAGIQVVVSFLTPGEITELNLEAEKKLSEAEGIRYLSFAIPDREVPESKAAALDLVRDLKQALVEGENVALHCRQGVGRSALMAAALLVSVGEEPANAFERIGSARGGKVPDTPEQQQWVAGLEKSMPPKGERLFEAYLFLQGITNYEVEKNYPGKSKRPDFTVTLDRDYLFEVKDFEPKDLLSSGTFDPHKRIRQKINEAGKKFKEYKDLPCCLVLYNNNDSLVNLESPVVMLGAMYGNLSINSQFLDGGKMIRPNSTEPQNTTISAIITLRQVEVGPKKLQAFVGELMKRKPANTLGEAYAETFSPDIDFDKHERQLGVIVWENAFARIPFPRHLFRGPYDERWEVNGDKIERGFVGSGIADLEELEDTETLLQSTS